MNDTTVSQEQNPLVAEMQASVAPQSAGTGEGKPAEALQDFEDFSLDDIEVIESKVFA
ncbi:hypothetical protein [Trinickia sp.]|uniref:hypothetical protein n=1 Tax=Trinickia sp. TaxID=2571163 RepID=UPI003F807AD1